MCEEQAIAQQKLTPQQEEELLKYIGCLTAGFMVPTVGMAGSFVSSIATEPVSESWTTSFINKHSIHLISQYSTGVDTDRHSAYPHAKHKLYFDLLQAKVAKYSVGAEHIYNIYGKGFMMGVTSGIKHVFSRRAWKETKEALQYDTRARVMLVVCMHGDKSALPPGLLYESANRTI